MSYRNGLSLEQVLNLLAQDCTRFEHSVSTVVTQPLTQNQFDALVAFVFNIGECAFQSSALVSLLNQGDYASVPAQLRRWNKAGGRVVEGLVNRREHEIALWNTPDQL